VYVLTFDKATCVFAPSDLLDRLAPVTDLDAEAALDPASWNDLVGAAGVTVGPMLHHYRDERDGLEEVAAGRRINPRDAESLAALRSAVTSEEWNAAGFTGSPAMMFGLFEGERMMAAANLNPGPDAATDIGFIVHPDGRGLGYGLGITATAARQAVLMHGVARLRALATSHSSLAIAGTLGFTEYGRNLTVYLG
jgi:hypothetical protein